MPKSTVSKTSAILIGLSFLAVSAYPVLAVDSTGSAVKPPARNQIEARKESIGNKAEAIREKLASKTASLRLKLQTFKDKKKAETADKVNINLNNINQKQTAQMQKHLDKMSAILDKLEARVESGKPDIKGPAAARTAIASARATIASVSAVVSAQALKDYTIIVTSEGRIGLDAKTQRDKLHTDLLSLRKIVIDAKQAVANAIRIAKSGPAPVDTGLKKEGTTSGKQ